MNQLNMPADVVLDQAVSYDLKNGVVSNGRLVFDAARGRFVHRLVSHMPDGSIERTEIYPSGDASDLIELLRSPEPATVTMELPGAEEPVETTLRLDPHDSRRFFFRAEDLLVGSGERISEYCPWCYVAAAGVVAVAGLVGYGLSEGYDVKLGVGVDLNERNGYIGLEFTDPDDDEDDEDGNSG